MNPTRLVKSSTGMIHKSRVGANITNCNRDGQRKLPRIVTCDDATAARASDAMFCKKCFPNGRPQ